MFLLVYISPINSWAFWEEVHVEITRSALPFLKPQILNEIVKGNLDEDDGYDSTVAANHFDACRFDDSVTNIDNKFKSLVNSKISPTRGAWTFGELLHPVQDFYSHSNFVEIGKDHIIENGWKSWADTFEFSRFVLSDQSLVILEGNLPDRWSMTVGIVPKITSPYFQDSKYGLFTHAREFLKASTFTDHCPSALEDWTHDKLNKDGPTPRGYAGDRGKYSEFHNKAKSLAVSQTAHEWCRLLYLVESSQGPSGAKNLFDSWVEKPVDALSGCRESSLHKNVVPNAVDTNGDGIPDSNIGSVPEDNGDGPADAVDTNGDGILDSSISEPEPLYQSQRYKCDPNSDTLQVNTKGDKVIELQTYLTDLGYGDLLGKGKIDGKFGLNTKNSVMTYQKDFSLSANGNVDTKTWSSLCEQISLLPK
jgi:hypothetical protein